MSPKPPRSNDGLAGGIAANPYDVVRRAVTAKNNDHVPSSRPRDAVGEPCIRTPRNRLRGSGRRRRADIRAGRRARPEGLFDTFDDAVEQR